MFLLPILLVFTLAFTEGGCSQVHKISLHPQKLDPQTAELRQKAILRMLKGSPELERRLNPETLYGMNQIPSQPQGFGRRLMHRGLRMNSSYEDPYHLYHLYLAEMTIGSPPQRLRVEINPELWSDLWVISSDIDDLSVIDDETGAYDPSYQRNTYNPSLSTSHVLIGKNYSDRYMGKGYNGTDLINIEGISASVTLGIASAKMGEWLRGFPEDGVFGLHPSKSQINNTQNLVTQLLAGVEKPIMTWWQNINYQYEGEAELTLGDEDRDNCLSNYVYAPQVDIYWYDDYDHRQGYFQDIAVHLTSANIDGSHKEIGLNMSFYAEQDDKWIFCHEDFFYVLTNASNARRTSEYVWKVDCDVSKAKDIVLNIGGEGDRSGGSKTKKLRLTGYDYIAYNKRFNYCYIRAYMHMFNKDRRTVSMDMRFMNNHCRAYNSQRDEIGYADVKVHKDIKTYGFDWWE